MHIRYTNALLPKRCEKFFEVNIAANVLDASGRILIFSGTFFIPSVKINLAFTDA